MCHHILLFGLYYYLALKSIQWILSTVDSHYCRNNPAYKDKKFLYPGTIIANLHHEYQEAAETAGVRVVGITYFSEVFHEEKYSIFIPCHDQCDVCVSFKHGNLNQANHEAHIKQKDEARNEKPQKKESASNKTSVWTMDLQAVFLCLNTKASSMYYKTKLQVHNFTLFTCKSKEGHSYIWNETEADLHSESL